MSIDSAPSIVSTLLLGLVVGLRHAFEPDHVAAVSAIATQRGSWLGSTLVGGLWGLGHALALFAAGAAVLLLQLRIPAGAELTLELCVGLMLVGLGANAVFRLVHGDHDRVRAHPHAHGGPGKGPLLIGIVHGLAGSGALMLLVLATIPSPLLGLAYIAVFGLGALGGMMALSALIALPALLTAQRFERAQGGLRLLAAGLSIAVGLFLVYEIGVVRGLLL
jgi:high-affinity nickel-transport protein